MRSRVWKRDFDSGYDAADYTDRIKDNKSSWCTLVAHVWGATGFIRVTYTCRSSWISFVKVENLSLAKWIIQQCKILYSFLNKKYIWKCFSRFLKLKGTRLKPILTYAIIGPACMGWSTTCQIRSVLNLLSF